jgi:hypothetical protein
VRISISTDTFLLFSDWRVSPAATGQASCVGYQGKSFMINSAKGYDADFQAVIINTQ